MAEFFSTEISGDFTIVDNSSLNGVIFHNVPTVYTADEDINCIYSITDDIEPEIGDMIGLFKVGWTSPCDYFSSVPAKVPVNNDKHFLNSTFGAHLIPNDSSELYQFCYVSKMRVVGASTPFTFEMSDIIAVEDPTDPGLLVFKSRVSQLKDEMRKLSDEKTYYATKYKILYSNFLKLKCEFDNLEKELLLERENIKRFKECKTAMNEEWEDAIDDQSAVSEECIESKNSELKSPSDVLELCDSSKLINEALNSGVWKSLYEIYEVATDINRSFNSQQIGNESQMPYKEFINYILEVFTATKQKFKIKGSGKIDESKYCKCYFEQKASCCPEVCSEPLFQLMMTQPLYMCFSNYNHYTKNSGLQCDGSFDSVSLTNYVQSMTSTNGNGVIKSGDISDPILFEQKNEPESEIIHTATENKIKCPLGPMLDGNKYGDQLRPEILSQMTEEREKMINELKTSREKIASLNSRINVLELELVAQQSSNLMKPELMISADDDQDLVPSSSQNNISVDSILECVHNEYIMLKDKYCELSKKIAKAESLEAKCIALEEENNKLIEYFTQIRDHNKKFGSSTNQVCLELESLILEKAKVEDKLINLQKESVGKISLNLVLHQKPQE